MAKTNILIIQERIAELEKEQEAARQIKETINDAIEQDEEYQDLNLKIHTLQRTKKAIVDNILETPGYQDAIKRLKAIRHDVKDLREMLSLELVSYNRQTEKNVFEDADHKLRKITIKATVKKTDQPTLL